MPQIKCFFFTRGNAKDVGKLVMHFLYPVAILPQVKDPLASAGGVASSLGRIGKTMAQHFFNLVLA